jgi:hypothetical protein
MLDDVNYCIGSQKILNVLLFPSTGTRGTKVVVVVCLLLLAFSPFHSKISHHDCKKDHSPQGLPSSVGRAHDS